MGEGDGLAVVRDGDGDNVRVRHRKWSWPHVRHRTCPLQVRTDPVEEMCAARTTGMVKPVNRAATTARPRIAFMGPRP
jgi:hypothetical protein